jgi:pimeloyl-ACP methyl ester carboxylesterase
VEPAPSEPTTAPDETPLAQPRDVTFTTSDGVELHGTLVAGQNLPVVILVHQLGSDRSEWAPLVSALSRAPALTTLTFDLRGHGASTHSSHGELSYHSFDHAEWAKTELDVQAAIAFVGRELDAGARKIALVGASVGSTAAIAAASHDPALRTLVALSPGRAYQGFDSITPALQLTGRSLLAVIAQDDVDGVDTAQALGRITSSEPVLVEGDAHGVALFGADHDLLPRVDAFLRAQLDRRAP